MKLILSRKGFDSSYGGMPSPILPDGRLLPLPIPSSHDQDTFEDLDAETEIDLDKILTDLSKNQHRISSRVHLDPDLHRRKSKRKDGWRPALGQAQQAQSHLQSQGVGVGDVFLFFGWFRSVQLRNGRWRYAKGAPHLHVIFGWLEVGDVLPIATNRAECVRKYPWIIEHPHAANPHHYCDHRNTIYIARDHSEFSPTAEFGGGKFLLMREDLRLSKEGCTRSVWSLPRWLHPAEGRPAISYHSDPGRWSRTEDEAILQTVGKGQEFVLDCNCYPEAKNWVASIVGNGITVPSVKQERQLALSQVSKITEGIP
ncbi:MULTISPECIES: hypothetical protein [unclassified Synechococcus]|uniref:Nmad3 family putative nucleotide modification protein n=1 Tax=Synechococcales TaxID=1890424 RepID=UPI0016253EB8|nr:MULTISPECIES: hypothetical protein [unclassified Synechococcus]